MALSELVRLQAEKLNIIIPDNVISMFEFAFSKLGIIDQYVASALRRVSNNLSLASFAAQMKQILL